MAKVKIAVKAPHFSSCTSVFNQRIDPRQFGIQPVVNTHLPERETKSCRRRLFGAAQCADDLTIVGSMAHLQTYRSVRVHLHDHRGCGLDRFDTERALRRQHVQTFVCLETRHLDDIIDNFPVARDSKALSVAPDWLHGEVEWAAEFLIDD